MPTINDRFVLAEELALKSKVSGLQVTYPKAIDVDVWYGWPNSEIREVTYPFIVIALADIQKSDRREHQGAPFQISYPARNYATTIGDPNGLARAEEWPTPYDIYHTITTVCLDPRHDRELKYKILGDKTRIPTRWAYLEVEDETARRLETVDITSSVERDAYKTEWFTTWTVLTESELFVGTVEDAYRVFSQVNISLRVDDSDLVEQITTVGSTP